MSDKKTFTLASIVDFNRRSGRQEYAVYKLLSGMIWLLFFAVSIGQIPGLAVTHVTAAVSHANYDIFLALMGFVVIWLLDITLSLPVTIRRLKDIGAHEAWCILYFAPYASVILFFILILAKGKDVVNYPELVSEVNADDVPTK